ncbi:MAG: ABC transporter permease subunit [Acidobacteriota bacterium]|nr:ABC transporter permease subunit [Acidobacteriota bacterium]MDH3785593.1 ABC transporter permease subunit [Acidobacteriota bacterium]
MRRFVQQVKDFASLTHHAARQLGGRRFWIAPLLPALWIGFQMLRLVIRWRDSSYTQPDAQNILIGSPLTVLAVVFGVRIVAGEIDRRTLEIAYTVPGGAQRIWIAKLAAAFMMLLASEAVLVALTWIFCTDVPWSAMYGAMQGAIFFLALSMSLAALFKGEASAGLVVIVIAAFIALFFQSTNVVLSPFWNAAATDLESGLELLGKTLQNRIGFVLVTAGIIALGFRRAENREKLLG